MSSDKGRRTVVCVVLQLLHIFIVISAEKNIVSRNSAENYKSRQSTANPNISRIFGSTGFIILKKMWLENLRCYSTAFAVALCLSVSQVGGRCSIDSAEWTQLVVTARTSFDLSRKKGYVHLELEFLDRKYLYFWTYQNFLIAQRKARLRAKTSSIHPSVWTLLRLATDTQTGTLKTRDWKTQDWKTQEHHVYG